MNKKAFTVYFFRLCLLFCGLFSAGSACAEAQQKEQFTLDEMVVVATREEEDVSRIPGNVSIITENQIKSSTAKEISDLLRQEAGIMVTTRSGTSPADIIVESRGFNNGGGNGGRTLVLIDGWKANRADTDSPDWATIPIDNVERIEIIRGPATAIYGDSAIGGVINIITKEGTETPEINAGIIAGSWEKVGERLSLQGAVDRFKYYLYGNYSEENGYRDNSEFSGANITANLSYQVNRLIGISGKIGYHQDDRQLPGSLSEDDLLAVGRRGSVTHDGADTDQFNIGINVDITPNDTQKGTIRLYHNDGQRDALSSYPGSGTTRIDDDEKDTSVSFRYTLNSKIGDMDDRIITGVDIINEEVDSMNFQNYPSWYYVQQQHTDFQRDLIGVYIHNRLSITDQLLFDAGIRFDRGKFEYQNITEDLTYSYRTENQGEKVFEQYSPKAAFTYLFDNDTSVYASYAKTFRFPNRDELTGTFGITPELIPEKGDNYEVGLKTNLGADFFMSTSVYYMTVKDEIFLNTPKIGSADIYSQLKNENFEEVIHKGIEVSLASSIIPRTMVYTSYTFTDTEIGKGEFKGSQMPITPQHMGSISATVDLGLGFSLWNQLRLVGQRYYANDLANALDKLPAYQVWDMKLSYEYKGGLGVLSAFCGINNILDKEYTENGGIGGTPWGSRIGIYPAPERNYVGGINYKIQF
jgi:iron complex outermembrane receptor protein